MGTGANYTEYVQGAFAINVHEVLPIDTISVTNISGQIILVRNLDFEAIEKGFAHNHPQVAANTNIFSTNIVPSYPPTNFRVQVIMSNTGIFSVVITNNGNSQVGLLNGGTALVAGALYIFDVLVYSIVIPGDGINFRYSSTGGVIRTIQVQEIDASSY